MAETNRRKEMSASMITPFMTMEDMCVEFFYKVLGHGKISMQILLVRQDLALLKLYQVKFTKHHLTIVNSSSIQ